MAPPMSATDNPRVAAGEYLPPDAAGLAVPDNAAFGAARVTEGYGDSALFALHKRALHCRADKCTVTVTPKYYAPTPPPLNFKGLDGADCRGRIKPVFASFGSLKSVSFAHD